MANSKYDRQARRWLATNSRTWIKLRALVLAEEPICRVCLATGVMPPRVSVICDHILGRADRPEDYAREMLQGLCREHDGEKSIFEDGGFAGTREKASPRGCDANGLPIDPGHHWRKPI